MIQKIYFLLIFIGVCTVSNAQLDSIYYHQDFELDSLPSGIPSEWNETSSPYYWSTRDGGRQVSGENNPVSAYEGNLNAVFIAQIETRPETFLVLPAINLKYAIEPELKFQHAQEEDDGDTDRLEVMYKSGKYGTWISLEPEYTLPTPTDTWVERTIPLPAGTLVDSCYLGFRATSYWGMGVCIDDIWVQEKGVLTKYLNSISFNQASTNFVASESSDNPILRIDVEIFGNSNTAILDSITVSSKNTDDNDIKSSGVKIFRTREPVFIAENQLGSGQSFASGNAEFNLDFDFPYGKTYLWVTYDIAQDATHEIHNHIADAYIDIDNIEINDLKYPASSEDPSGDRTIIESIFFDDFETLTGWILSPVLEFEIDTPQGKGNWVDHQLSGETDPPSAYQGYRVLGTDLRGGSDPFPYGYDSTLTSREYSAISPLMDFDYYRELKLNFQRWLNVGPLDEASIDISTNGGSSWSNLWKNIGVIDDASWQEQEITLPDSMVYQQNVKVRIGIGPTSESLQYTGWNIDNFAIVGNYISTDVAVTDVLSPLDGCGHSSADSITITVENIGGLPTNDTIPMVYSPDGLSMIRDTIFASLGVGEDTTYTFTPTVDLSAQGLYDEAFAATELPGDEYRENDSLFATIYVPPTFNLPYFENFENGNLHWIPEGTNSSWQFGEPGGSTINAAASPDSAWITNLSGNYSVDEDSYLESPCFNLLDINYSIFEMKLWSDTEDGVDGGALEYSIDNGASWNIAEKLMYKDFNWLWYTNTTGIAATGTNGWDTISNGYMTVSTFLPEIIQGQSGAKFRITFASDGNPVSHEGFAVDDIKIYEAPANTGVTSIDYPGNPICETTSSELIIVSVQNFGLDTLYIGESIILAYEFDGGPQVRDTIILTEIIKPDSIKQFTFNTPINISTQSTYNLKAYTIDEFPNFYTSANDTIEDNIEVRGNPTVELGSDLYTVKPDTVELNAYGGTVGFNYIWQDLITTDSVFQVTDGGDFSVTVTDPATSCFTIDSTTIIKLIADIGIDSLVSLESDCKLADSVLIQSRIFNYGTDTLLVNDTVKIAYAINGAPARIDTFLLPEILYPDSMYTFTSKDTFDMAAVKPYDIKLYTMLPDDNDTNNDTLNKIITVHGYPAFTLAPEDTVLRAIQYTLDAGAGFASYAWEDATPTQTYDATSNGWYYVTVTDVNDCPANDSSYIELIIQDIAVTSLTSPTPACGSATESVDIVVSNLGNDTIFIGDTLVLGYLLDDAPTGRDSIFLTFNFLPTNTINHTFSTQADLSSVMIHEFKSFSKTRSELIEGNDTLTTDVESMDVVLPINLGPATLEVGLPYFIDAGDGPGYSYLWQDGVTTDQNYYAQEPGLYSVTVTDMYNCTGSDEITIIPSAIIEINNESATLNIYPNPVNNILHFELITPQEISLIIELIDMNGKIVYKNNLHGYENLNDDIPVDNYPDGTYIFKVIIDDTIYTKQIIIQ